MFRKMIAMFAAVAVIAGAQVPAQAATTTYWSSAGLYTGSNAIDQHDGASMTINGAFWWSVSYSGSGWNSNPGSYCDVQASIHNTTNGFYKKIDINTDIISSPNRYNEYLGNIGTSHWEFTIYVSGWNCYSHMMIWI
jgi:hypothetical protein